jgi:hypothetical protein
MGLKDQELFKDHSDYWQVAENIRDIYMSEGSLLSLLDFERVLDELDLYAFKNWAIGELVQGPEIGKYRVGCIFMWPEKLMPDPRGAKRLLPFDCEVRYKKTNMKIHFICSIYSHSEPLQVEKKRTYYINSLFLNNKNRILHECF